MSVWKRWFEGSILGNLHTLCVICVRANTGPCVHIIACKCLHFLFQCKLFSLGGNTYVFHVHQGPDTRPAACQMSFVRVSYVKMRISHSCVCKLKPVHLLPLWSACLRYRDTSVAPGSADVGANAARLFTLNHVGTLQTPCCCSYGLASSSYWLPAKLKAGERLIKGTWVCVARQGPGCGFYWLPGLINNCEPKGELVSSHILLRCLHDVGCKWADGWAEAGCCLCKCQCEFSKIKARARNQSHTTANARTCRHTHGTCFHLRCYSHTP